MRETMARSLILAAIAAFVLAVVLTAGEKIRSPRIRCYLDGGHMKKQNCSSLLIKRCVFVEDYNFDVCVPEEVMKCDEWCVVENEP